MFHELWIIFDRPFSAFEVQTCENILRDFDTSNALAHAGIYSMPFFLLAPSFWWLLIFGTHFFIDRYRLAQHWICLVNWKWDGDNFGFSEDKPKWMSVWLLIIVDNTFHIIFNSTAIYLHNLKYL